MEQSQIPLVVELFIEKNKDTGMPVAPTNSRENKKAAAKTTLGMQFRNQLIGLITNLKTTEPHFIRCIKPNHLKKPSILQGSLALCQLKPSNEKELIKQDLPKSTIALVDFSNAVNCVDRASIIDQVFQRCPSLLAHVVPCTYCCPARLYIGNSYIKSQKGVQQGHPLGLLLSPWFCIPSSVSYAM
eukprot:gene40612-49515_t